MTFNLNETDINELFVRLIKEYPLYFQEPERIKEIIYLFKVNESDTITMVIESDYVDRQYRDSYYFYFSQKYSNYERNCIRLAFFEGELKYKDFMSYMPKIGKDILIGTVVLRPLNVGNIGHTLLNPHKLKINGYVQTCKFKTMICGRKFTIRAFPYLTQDNETMTCAETALFNLIQYYSEKYCEYRILMPSEILRTLEESSYERVLPSQGVDDVHMAKVLQAGHFYPRLYPYESEEAEGFEELFYAYVESGIPFILGLPQHAVICIGHGSVDFKMDHHKLRDIVSSDIFENKKIYNISTARLVDEYIFMDDNEAPYIISTIDKLTVRYYENSDISYEEEEIEKEDYGENNESDLGDNQSKEQMVYTEDAISGMKRCFDSLLVPLYKRIFLDASRAKSIFEEHFLHNPDFIEKLQEAYGDNTWGYSEDNPLVWRMYLASSNSYKEFKCKTALNTDIFIYYSSQPYPRFIWVLEIGTISTFSEHEARVEILLDATSSSNSNTWAILSIGYKGHMVFVPYVVRKLNEKQTAGLNIYKEEDSPDQDFGLANWEKISDDVNQRVLTVIFESLYYKDNKFVNDTYKIFCDYNLKEI